MGLVLADRLQRELHDDTGRLLAETRARVDEYGQHVSERAEQALLIFTARGDARAEAFLEEVERTNAEARAALLAEQDRGVGKIAAQLKSQSDAAQQLAETLTARTDDCLASVTDELSRLEATRADLVARRTEQVDMDALLRELSDVCATTVTNVEETLEALEAKDRQARQFYESLIQDAARVRDQGISVRDQLSELAETMRDTQRDAARSQELSQEINTHSLSLNEHSGQVLARFDALSERNGVMMTELLQLKNTLEAGDRAVTVQLDQLAAGTARLGEADARYAELSAAAEDVQARMEDALGRVDERIDVSRTLTADAASALESLQTERARWLNLVADVEATRDGCAATGAAADEAAAGANAVAADLRSELADASELRNQALSLLESGEARAEALQVALQDAETTRQDMRNATRKTHQITDDLYRGLNSAVESQRLSESRAAETLAETSRLQAEMEDILSLQDGLDGFRRGMEAQDERVDQCLETIEALRGRLDTQQGALEEHAAAARRHNDDVARYQNTIAELTQRLSRFETRLEDQALRTDDLAQAHELADRETVDVRGEVERMQTQVSNDLSRQLRRTEAALQREAEEAELRAEKRLSNIECQLENDDLRADVRDIAARQRATEDGFGRITEHVAALRADEFGELQQIADTADRQFDSLFERVETIEHRDRDTRLVIQRLDGDREALKTELSELRRSNREPAGADSFTSMIDRFNESMDDAVATNRQLREALGTLRATRDRHNVAPPPVSSQAGTSAARRIVEGEATPARATDAQRVTAQSGAEDGAAAKGASLEGAGLESAALEGARLDHATAGSGRDGLGPQGGAPDGAAGLAGGALGRALARSPRAPSESASPSSRDPSNSTRARLARRRPEPALEGKPPGTKTPERSHKGRRAVVSAAMGAALLITGVFGGQQLDARTVNEVAGLLEPELNAEVAGHGSSFA